MFKIRRRVQKGFLYSREIDKSFKAQVLIEAIFSFLIIMFMIFGAIKVFRWTGVDFAARQRAHEEQLVHGIPVKQHDTYRYFEAQARQLKENFYPYHKRQTLNAIWKGDVTLW